MNNKARAGIGAGLGLLAIIMGLIYIPQPQLDNLPIPTPVGDEIPDDNSMPVQDEPVAPVVEIAPVADDQGQVTDGIVVQPLFTQDSSDNSPRLTSHSGGGGGSNNNDDDDDNNPDDEHDAGDAAIRMLPSTIPPGGIDLDVFGLTSIHGTTHVVFELCNEEDSCTTQSDSTDLSPPSFTPTPESLECDTSDCEEYSTNFAQDLITAPGEYYAKATFYDSDNNVLAVRGLEFDVPPILVIPESPIGMLALVVSSLGSLGAYVAYTRMHGK